MTGGTVPLKYRAEIMAGQSPASADVTDLDEGQPFLQGNAEFGPLHPTPRYQCDVAVKVAAKGDLLMSVRAPVGALNIADQTYGIGRGLCAIRPESVPHEYVWWWLHHAREELESVATGSTFSAVSAGQVGALPLPEMEPEYYHRIADFLDRETAQVDAMIAKQEELVGLLGERRSAVIAHAVTKGLNPDAPMRDSGVEWYPEVPVHWGVGRLGYYFEVTLGKMLDAGRAPRPDDVTLPYVRAANIQDSGLDLTNLNEMPFSPTEAASLSLQAEDLLVVEGGAVGTAVVLDEDMPGLAFQKTVNRVRATRCVSTRFLSYVVRVLRDMGAIDVICNKSTIPHLTAEKLAAIRVPLPPRAEQVMIAAALDLDCVLIDATVAKARESISLMRERRAALISDAVTGRLDIDTYGRAQEVASA